MSSNLNQDHQQECPEEDQIQLKIKDVTNQSVESTRRMKDYCITASEAGTKTVVELDRQGEQLDLIEGQLRDIHEDVGDAEKTLRKMNACCWGAFLPVAKLFHRKKKDPLAFQMKKNVKNSKKYDVDQQHQKGLREDKSSDHTNYICKYADNAEEDEIEGNLKEVASYVGNLRNMAIDISAEVDAQNVQLEGINVLADHNASQILNANKQANRLLK